MGIAFDPWCEFIAGRLFWAATCLGCSLLASFFSLHRGLLTAVDSGIAAVGAGGG